MNNNFDKINIMKKIVKELTEASKMYYKFDKQIMTDKEYDALYDKLKELEDETGIILANSPTNKVQGYILDGYKKVTHSKPMLSADKTKDLNVIKKFIGYNKFYGSMKLDGLTLVVRYENGEFKQGVTRGNGTIGEDVTEACKFIKNLPMKIPYKESLELRGECVVSWEEFNKINETLTDKYSHPRNFAAGTLRNLDLNVIKERTLYFVAFECVTDFGIDSKFEILEYIENLGFETVQRTNTKVTVDDAYIILNPKLCDFPVDGIIFEIDSRRISESLGKTSHHENCRMALKWKDEVYETKLIDIDWTMGKTGVLTPTAVFEPVEIDGTIVERASVHNVSILEKLKLKSGDVIEVYKANMIIPQIHRNVSAEQREQIHTVSIIPATCPVCGKETSLIKENDSTVLICSNPNCKGKLLGKLTHFCSRDAMNIDGLSEQTLYKFIELGWLKNFEDIYQLSSYKDGMYYMEGFGDKSITKLLDSIEHSKKTDLSRFIYSLSIPLIGKSASKELAKIANGDVNEFISLMNNSPERFLNIDGFGNSMFQSLTEWWVLYSELFENLSKKLNFENGMFQSNESDISLEKMTFVITGKLGIFENRNSLVSKIESLGGKVSGSVSAKTNYLINNDTESNSSKNKKAKELNIPIISEEDFLKMIEK